MVGFIWWGRNHREPQKYCPVWSEWSVSCHVGFQNRILDPSGLMCQMSLSGMRIRICSHKRLSGPFKFHYRQSLVTPLGQRTQVPARRRQAVLLDSKASSSETYRAKKRWGSTRCHTSPQDYEVMNLSEWANHQGIHPQTAYRWFREGNLPVPARKIGRLILVGDLETPSSRAAITALYARVSSSDQRTDLDRQVARVSAWATAHGYSIDRVVCEVGSGLNGNRRKFRALLTDPTVTTIVVEHRDRFAHWH